MQQSFIVEMTWPARGPKLSLFQKLFSYLYYILFYSYCERIFFSFYRFPSYCLISVFNCYIIFICSRIKIEPISSSLANGPDVQARLNPFLMAVNNSTGVVLYSYNNLSTFGSNFNSHYSWSKAPSLTILMKDLPWIL